MSQKPHNNHNKEVKREGQREVENGNDPIEREENEEGFENEGGSLIDEENDYDLDEDEDEEENNDEYEGYNEDQVPNDNDKHHKHRRKM